VPLLTKHDLRIRARTWCRRSTTRRRSTAKKTSGSTGVSVEVVVDEMALAIQARATLRSDEWSGWRSARRVAMVWAIPNT
jgi:phenylacetate-coenzyme A ligase PaaK-like adenylate-forming protein